MIAGGRCGPFSPVLVAALLVAAWGPAWMFAHVHGGAGSVALWLAVAITGLTGAGSLSTILTSRARDPDFELPQHRSSLLATLMLVAAATGAGLQAVVTSQAAGPADLRLAGTFVIGVVAAGAPVLLLRPGLFLVFTLGCVGPLTVYSLTGVAADPALAVVIALAAVAILLAQGLSATRLGRVYAAELEQRARLRRLEQANQALSADRMTLQAESRTDALTGLANRRYLEEVLHSEWNRCRRSGASLSCLLLDIDHFKSYNDHYGHDGGDACLRRVAAILADSTRRAGDLVARFGGEEFVVLLPEASVDGATTVADLLKRAVADAGIAHAQSPLAPHLTISLGVASVVPDSQRSAEELVKAADLALYEAKRSGRNRVVLANAEILDSARLAARGVLG